ncbi:hypothetical protein LTR84_003461 [Exophiala bonariae]|uniref:NmrA-like domain-containing protein n=1 Tax=Exophiala bonariae TaxID=1690606 RepID=A0AAV9N776_9EURO|nr:hypothetical protein LTR84_003461 [Exophiala bonariae]
MKVAVAGTGNVAHYLIEELPKAGHEVIVLTRKTKAGRNYSQRETDYSVESLLSVLNESGAEGLVSTIADYANPPNATQIHFNMLEACTQSEKCKSYIPSEWTCDVQNYPEQPMFMAEANDKLHGKLKVAEGVRWTVFCNSWFADYVVPPANRVLPEIGPLWPMDHENKACTIYGPGDQRFSVCSVRDAAKAVAALLNSSEPWEQYTFVAGDYITCNELFAVMKKRDPEWTSKNKSLAETVKSVVDNKSPELAMLGYFELLIYSGSSRLPEDAVQRQRDKFFPNIHFRSMEELLDLAGTQSDIIV